MQGPCSVPRRGRPPPSESILKKELGALCALLSAAMALPALAQPKDFTVYGTMDLGVRHASGLTDRHMPASGSQNSLSSGLNDASRWGVRGTTPLGGGLNAVFELESGLNADTGMPAQGTPFFDRGSWIGLQDTSGNTLKVGRQASLLADALVTIDPLQRRFPDFNPNMTVGALARHGLGTPYGNTGIDGNAYWLNNALKLTNRTGPYQFSAMYSAGEQAGDHKPLSSGGLGLAWEENGTAAAGAYQTFRDASGRQLKAWNLGLSHRAGNVRLAASAARSQTGDGEAARTRQRVVSVGATLSTTQQSDWTLAYYKVDRERASLANDGYGRFVAFYEYRLSMRTKLYAEFDLTNWDDGYQGAGNKSRATGFGLGMQYRF